MFSVVCDCDCDFDCACLCVYCIVMCCVVCVVFCCAGDEEKWECKSWREREKKGNKNDGIWKGFNWTSQKLKKFLQKEIINKQRVNDLVKKLSKKNKFKIEKDKKNDRKRYEMKLVEIGIKRFPSFLSIFQLFLLSPLFHYISLFFLSHVFIKNLYHSLQKDFSHFSYFFCILLYLCLIFISYHL